MYVERDRLAPLLCLVFLVGWYASADSLPSGDVIFAQQACHLNDIFLYI
jgi:hypothetical protein